MENEFDVLMESFPKRKLRDFIEPINKRRLFTYYGEMVGYSIGQT